MIITDLAEFIPLIQLNIDRNQENLTGKAEAEVLSWGSQSAVSKQPDYILVADCIYYQQVSVLYPSLQFLKYIPVCHHLKKICFPGLFSQKMM